MKNIIIILCAVFAVSLTMIQFKTSTIKPVINQTPSEIENITSFHFFRTNGYEIYSDIRYDIDKDETTDKYIAKVKLYGEPEENTKEIEITKDKVQELEKKLNQYEVVKWDGFNKSDDGVCDGDSFSLSITMENDEEISAHGYMMWPEHYRDVLKQLDSFFTQLMEQNL